MEEKSGKLLMDPMVAVGRVTVQFCPLQSVISQWVPMLEMNRGTMGNTVRQPLRRTDVLEKADGGLKIPIKI